MPCQAPGIEHGVNLRAAHHRRVEESDALHQRALESRLQLHRDGSNALRAHGRGVGARGLQRCNLKRECRALESLCAACQRNGGKSKDHRSARHIDAVDATQSALE